MNIANLKVGTRLSLGFALVLALLLMVAALGYSRLTLLDEHMDLVINDRYPKIVMVDTVSKELNVIARIMRNVLITSDRQEIRKEFGRLDDSRKIIAETLDKLDKRITSVKGKELLANLMTVRSSYTSKQEMFVKLVAENKTEEAKTLLWTEARPLQLAYFDALEKLTLYQESLVDESGKVVAEAYFSACAAILVLTVVALALGALAAWLITRGLLKQLGGEPDYAAAIAGKIAEGDLAVAIEIKANDRSSLLFAIKAMRDNLAKIVAEVRTDTDAIAAASGQIAAGNQDLSSRTEQQAGSLEETATQMNELTSMVKQNADNSRLANQLAVTASEVAVTGGAVVSKVVDTMDSINESARKIVDIIGVIDGVAFQTNILALNAAVEAARAGEQGRGFAVVASEVRSLAQRSAAAAKEIKTLIGDSVEKVDAGSKLVEQAGTVMKEIVASIQQVTDIMGETMAASREQSAGIEQVNQAISQMDGVTQQNAALVEESAAATGALRNQADNLVQAVSVFKLKDLQAVAPAGRMIDVTPPAALIPAA